MVYRNVQQHSDLSKVNSWLSIATVRVFQRVRSFDPQNSERVTQDSMCGKGDKLDRAEGSRTRAPLACQYEFFINESTGCCMISSHFTHDLDESRRLLQGLVFTATCVADVAKQMPSLSLLSLRRH
eukprot:COSAG02_NODE_869_length_16359_cov_49.339176_6_plen_126_part_00